MFSVNIRWLIADRVILGEFCGEGDLDCCQQTLSRIQDLLDESTQPIQIVLDMSRVTTPLKDPHEMFLAAHRFRQHPHMGQVILVTQNPAIRLSGRILAQFLGASFHAVNTMTQALAILRRVDPKLDLSRQTAVA
jgi:hypothetical protein